jgi:peptidoglycan hydrolase-like protein with peptidoglycan-binding domain
VPEKRNRRAAARNDDAGSFISADGVIGRLVDHAFDNPAMSGGLFVMALTASAIVSNALFLQNVRHPEPLFSTRPPLVIERHAPGAPAVPIPPHRDESTGSIAPPLPRPAPIPPMAVDPGPAESEALIREIQTVLARKGLYLGAIDGKFGALSRSAITAYEQAEGLPVTGEPSAALLDRMKTAAAAPPASPPPVVAAIPPELPPSPSVATAPVQEVAPPPVPQGPSPQEIEAELKRLRYERVQTALNRIGYGPVAVDGTPNQETINAIRRFELDNGLPISGLAGDGVVDRLIAIGALPAT